MELSFCCSSLNTFSAIPPHCMLIVSASTPTPFICVGGGSQRWEGRLYIKTYLLLKFHLEAASATLNNDNSSMRLHAPQLHPQAACELTETDVFRGRHGRAPDSTDNSQ